MAGRRRRKRSPGQEVEEDEVEDQGWTGTLSDILWLGNGQ